MGYIRVRPGDVTALVALTLGYLLLGHLSSLHTLLGLDVSPVWAPSGLAIGMLVVYGTHLWPAVGVAVFLLEFQRGNGFGVAFGIAVGVVLSTLIAVRSLRARKQGLPYLESLSDVIAFLFWGALTAGLLASLSGSLVHLLSRDLSSSLFLQTALTWFLGDAMGAVVVGGLILAWWGGGAPWFSQRGKVLFWALVAVVLIISIPLFVVPLPFPFGLTLFLCAMFPLSACAAVQFGLQGATLVTFMLSIVSIAGTYLGSGPFAGYPPLLALAYIMTFLGISSVTGLIIAAISQERRESDRKMRTISMSSPIGVFFVNARGEVVETTYRMGRILRLHPEKALGMGWLEAIHPEDREDLLAAWQSSVAARGSLRHSCRLLNGNGDPSWITIRLAPSHVEDRVRGYVGSIADVTAVKHAEEALRESRSRLTSAIEHLPFDFWLCDIDGRIVLQNSVCTERWGNLVGLLPEESGLPEAAVAVWRRNVEFANRGEVTQHEFSVLVDGAERRFRTIVGPVWEMGVVRGSSGVCLDLTDERRIIEAFEESERERVLILRSLPGMTYRCGLAPGYGLETVSEGCFMLTGYTQEEMVGSTPPMSFLKIVHPDDVEWLKDRCAASLAARRPFQGEYRIVDKHGDVRWVWEHALGIISSDGNVTGIEGFLLDITSRKVLEDNLFQAQRLDSIGRLAGGIAHDFNNLLTTILGYVELTLKDFSREDPRRSRIEQISEVAHRAAGLTKQLLTFAKKQKNQLQEVKLNDLIREINRLLDRVIGENIRMELVLGPDVPSVRVDPSQLDQVLLNLCVNARDAMPEGGSLTIATSTLWVSEDDPKWPEVIAGRYVLLSVRDTGAGIPSEVLPKIFDPFFTTKASEKGTGLGLSTCYGIVRQSDGYIFVESEVGRGSEFRILLPIASVTSEVECSREERDVETVIGNETLLLVEDEEALRRVAEQILVARGFRVLIAANAREALEIVASHEGQISLVVTDVIMPGMSGRELVDRLRDQGFVVPVLYLSGYSDHVVDAEELAREDVRFLEKPFSPPVFLRTVRESIDRERFPLGLM